MRILRPALIVGAMFSFFGAQAAEWSDTSITYSVSAKYREPGNNKNITKNVIGLQHISGNKYGTNFFAVDMLKSGKNDPAGNSRRGAQEVFAVYQNTLSFSKLSQKPIKFGPVRDVGFQSGFEYNSRNDAFGAGLVRLVLGPKLEFDVPGLLTLGLFYFKEWNNNSIASGVVPQKNGNVNFDATARLGAVWGFDVQAGLPAIFKGFATYTGAKGHDGFGVKTAPELYLDTSFMWDVSQLFGKSRTFYAGIGYLYIHNKYGNKATMPGTKTSAPLIRFEAHF